LTPNLQEIVICGQFCPLTFIIVANNFGRLKHKPHGTYQTAQNEQNEQNAQNARSAF